MSEPSSEKTLALELSKAPEACIVWKAWHYNCSWVVNASLTDRWYPHLPSTWTSYIGSKTNFALVYCTSESSPD